MSEREPVSDRNDKAEELYAEIEETFGTVPNFFEAQGEVDPEWLELNWNRWQEIMLSEGALDRQTRELIAITVSILNDCEYCIAAHEMQARQEGGTDEELAEVRKIIELFESFNSIANSLDIEIDESFQE